MAQFIANLVRVPLMEELGRRFRYSERTTVLGRLVEIWSNKPFEAFLDERIFRPLRMTDTMFWAATPDQRARLTRVYGPAQGGGLTMVETETLPFTERPTLIEGAVGLLSTVPDYARFSQMLLNKGEYGWDDTAGTIFWIDPSKEIVHRNARLSARKALTKRSNSACVL